MPIIETLGFGAIAPSTTETLGTLLTGDSSTVRNCEIGTDIFILEMWKKGQGAAGIAKVICPRLHDNVQGIRLYQTTSPAIYHAPRHIFLQKLMAQDQLNMYLTGSAVGGDIELAYLTLYYSDLNGVSGRFLDYQAFRDRVKNIIAFQTTITGGTTLVWSGATAIATSFDNLKANTDYAILGCTSNGVPGAIRYKSADLANFGAAVPGEALYGWMSDQYFVDKAQLTGLPTIPVFNAANKANTFIDVSCDENGGTFIVTTFLAELAM